MKRHQALRDLSSDHHQGLVQARRMIQAAGGESPASQTQPAASGEDLEAGRAGHLAQAAREILTFWAEHTEPHFREEEEVLLPAFAVYGNTSEKPIVRMLADHVAIRHMVSELRSQVEQNQANRKTMRTIGEMLRAHIRHEEDVVFPLIEEAMGEEGLRELSGRLAASADRE